MKKKKRIYNEVIRWQGAKKTFMEFGWIKNPKFKNDIYMWVKSNHKLKKDKNEDFWEIRTDEALSIIHGLAMAIQGNMGLTVKFQYDAKRS